MPQVLSRVLKVAVIRVLTFDLLKRYLMETERDTSNPLNNGTTGENDNGATLTELNDPEAEIEVH